MPARIDITLSSIPKPRRHCAERAAQEPTIGAAIAGAAAGRLRDLSDGDAGDDILKDGKPELPALREDKRLDGGWRFAESLSGLEFGAGELAAADHGGERVAWGASRHAGGDIAAGAEKPHGRAALWRATDILRWGPFRNR
jgi:hypothetical protein